MAEESALRFSHTENESDMPSKTGTLCVLPMSSFSATSALFMKPCESSIIGAYMCQKNNVLQMIPKEKVSQCKRAIKIDHRQRVVYLTILHNHDK